jgi:hypothetical protein
MSQVQVSQAPCGEGEIPATNKSMEILERMKLVELPREWSEFWERVIDELKTPRLKEGILHVTCGYARVEWTDSPEYIKVKNLDVASYIKTRRIDKLICNDEEYEIVAEAEEYEVERTYILHSYRVLEIKKTNPPNLGN